MPESPDAYIIEDVGHELENPQLREVLAPSAYYPTAIRLAQICERYRVEPTWRLLGCRSGQEIVGCIGLELGDTGQATIRHIAVAPVYRGAGIGTALIHHVLASFAITQLSAETDYDAVEFYRKCGFSIHSLGEKYPGTERFLCTYSVCEAEKADDIV